MTLKRKLHRRLGLPYSYDTQYAPIRGFFGDKRFLSNFFLRPLSLYGIEFPSSEHAFMWHKSEDAGYRKRVLAAPTPKRAKAVGKSAALRPDWDKSYKFEAMLRVLRAKFRDPELRKWLLDTGQAYLEETNTWGDIIWGRCNGVGENHLGRLLMIIRYELQQSC
ncbi:TPA: NADAR family protein [Escherichia coli]|uniref:NADAR protein n=14 Tax=root TaxID=1 RepID=A0A8S5UHJ6_9CAUD|nr:NADAR family protein [Staphylococcus aureus]ELL1201310.1 NADAR family protein [Staphylococcus aureus]DAF93936.1 MAG TPA: NADAR protein [Myoviridae sp. ctu2j3]DAF93969.1 MAG TPA: NADAR protein [Myoviridae sp. ctu2j3]HDW3906773.1 NADAR family protein [Escherichia coli]